MCLSYTLFLQTWQSLVTSASVHKSSCYPWTSETDLQEFMYIKAAHQKLRYGRFSAVSEIFVHNWDTNPKQGNTDFTWNTQILTWNIFFFSFFFFLSIFSMHNEHNGFSFQKNIRTENIFSKVIQTPKSWKKYPAVLQVS